MRRADKLVADSVPNRRCPTEIEKPL